uniref:Uncharacterized protein n=1 Tax=Candidatus Kentrum sp. LPFa TaxID=2126335 RepID=A0A450XTY8_9GAMM|nr:MAG: hypothetical protein BECKLPF1236A_GA0070988_101895 [Candidatus Kentron sp. LPFa]VFK32732.1 MAG: hypothetical protein BECKLPF1236C_GA0070990_101795 [Candidatus Kentron sp. LPFa]
MFDDLRKIVFQIMSNVGVSKADEDWLMDSCKLPKIEITVKRYENLSPELQEELKENSNSFRLLLDTERSFIIFKPLPKGDNSVRTTYLINKEEITHITFQQEKETK